MTNPLSSEADVLAIKRGVAAFGPRIDEAINKETRALYAQYLVPTPAAMERQDIAYGSNERHRLDLYSAGGNRLPIVLFAPAGGFSAGDKRPTELFYGNIGRFFASKGFLAATMNYRLAPAHSFPSGLQDVAAAVEWLASNANLHGGDPSRIGLMGQAAGASHVAGYLFDPQTASSASKRVRAAVLLSGHYFVRPPLSPGQQGYFGEDVALYAERSPATHAANSQLPVLLGVSEFDPPPIARQTLDFASVLTGVRGICPPVHWLAGHNHVSTVLSLGTTQHDVGDLLVEFFDTQLAQVAPLSARG
jgi:acetyl esterase/lipase